MTDPFIRLSSVRKEFETRGETFLAVSDVTFDVAEGELVALVGPSGCGKTTVLKMIAGLHDHSGGDMQIGGTDGGMQQRAAIARSLVHDPKVVLMDEPFGALDALTRESMNIELLRIWSESKKTILFVTHGIQEAVFLGSRVIVLTSSPARMAGDIPVDLPYPRKLEIKTNEDFGVYTRQIYGLLGMA